MAYPNLPGVNVTLNDMGLQISAPPAGPKVTILGVTANEGIPKNEPLTVLNVGAATAALTCSGLERKLEGRCADVTFPSEMALAVEEAAAAGAQSIEIMVINHLSGAAYEQYLDPTTVGPQLRYGDLTTAYEILMDNSPQIVVPCNAWADDAGTSGYFGTQLANFCHQATTEVDSACVGVLPMMPVNHWAATYSGYIANADPVTLSGEVWGLHMSTLPGLVDLSDLYFQVPSAALVGAWARYAGQYDGLGSIEVPTSPTTVYIGGTLAWDVTFPPAWSAYLAGSENADGEYNVVSNAANAATAVNPAYWAYWQAIDLDGTLATDAYGNKVDAGARISVVGAPLRTTQTLTANLRAGLSGAVTNMYHTTDGAAAYAGFMSSLRPHSAPTNKQISNLAPQKTLSAKQANAIAGRRIATFHRRSTGFVVASAITGAHNVSKYVRSDYVRLSTVRIVDATLDIVRAVGDRFIGEPNTAAHRNAMSAEIDKMLSKMKGAGALNDYQFYVSATPDEQVLGEVSIDMTLVPAFETVKINLTVSLAKAIS